MECCRPRRPATIRRRWCCWMTPTRSKRPPRGRFSALALASALSLAACSPGGPPGVNRDELDAQVSKAIGDPASCLLIAKSGSGRLLYRYNSATACDRELPACSAPGKTKVAHLLEATAKDGQPR